MSLSAFQNNATTKTFFIQRLQSHLEQDQVIRELASWDGTQGSPTGCTAHGDLKQYQQLTGIPAGLGWLHDWMFTYEGHSPEEALALSWLKAIEPGQDLGQVEIRFVLWMFDAAKFGVLNLAKQSLGKISAEVVAVLETTAYLYRQSLEREVPADQWKALRMRAVDVADESTGRVNQHMAAIAEAWAWPPGSALTATVDGMRNWQAAHTLLVGESVGWSDDWEALWDAVKAKTEAYAEEHQIEDREEFFAVYSGLMEQEPELAKRLQIQQAALSVEESERELYKRQQLLALIREAPGA